jgi:hypothetical protein
VLLIVVELFIELDLSLNLRLRHELKAEFFCSSGLVRQEVTAPTSVQACSSRFVLKNLQNSRPVYKHVDLY